MDVNRTNNSGVKQSMTPSLITHDFPLRPDLIVRLTLPVDLTAADAERMAAFIAALAVAS